MRDKDKGVFILLLLLILIPMIGRDDVALQLENWLSHFQAHKYDLECKRSVYIQGSSGVGKTFFVKQVLTRLNYEIVYFNTVDVRTSAVIAELTQKCNNVMSMFNSTVKPIAIVMDEIDGMNNGDKSGLNSLIKLLRMPKSGAQNKRKKIVKTEPKPCLPVIITVPVICIGNDNISKKINELIHMCSLCISLPPLTPDTIRSLIFNNPSTSTSTSNSNDVEQMLSFAGHNMRLLEKIIRMYSRDACKTMDFIRVRALMPTYIENEPKQTARNMFFNIAHRQPILTMKTFSSSIADTDHTSVGLIWHENVGDLVPRNYLAQLDNVCISDGFDCVRFNKQLWQLNELSSYVKTFKNYLLLYEQTPPISLNLVKKSCATIRFTKIITKFATEFHNCGFIQELCQSSELFDKHKLIALFFRLHAMDGEAREREVNQLLSRGIEMKTIARMFRYIDKYVNESAVGVPDVLNVNVELDTDVEKEEEEEGRV